MLNHALGQFVAIVAREKGARAKRDGDSRDGREIADAILAEIGFPDVSPYTAAVRRMLNARDEAGGNNVA